MSNTQKTLSFIEHLEELRYRLVIALAAWMLATCVSFPLAPYAMGLLTYPLKAATSSTPATPRITLKFSATTPKGADPSHFTITGTLDNITSGTASLDQARVDLVLPDGRVRSLSEGARTEAHFYYRGLTDPIMLWMKTSLILGLILVIPIWAWQIWAFVAPGLRPREKRLAKPLFGLTAILFPLGAAFAYFLLKLLIGFLLKIRIDNLDPLLDYGTYVRFALKLMGSFGLLFEMPVVVLLLAQLGFVTPAILRKYRRVAVVVIAIVAMIAAPTPDPFTMILMMLPLLALYELSVWLTVISQRWTQEAAKEETAEGEE